MKYSQILLTLFTILFGLDCTSSKLIIIDSNQLEISILIDDCLVVDPTDIFFEFKNLTGEEIIVNAHAINFQDISDLAGSKINPKYHYADLHVQDQQFYSIPSGNSVNIPYNLNFMKLFDLDPSKNYYFNFTYDNHDRKMKGGRHLLVGKMKIPATSFTICK